MVIYGENIKIFDIRSVFANLEAPLIYNSEIVEKHLLDSILLIFLKK